MIKTVFLDLDGCLVDFRRGVHKAFDIPYDYATLSNKWLFWEDWNDVTFDEVDSICTIDFWAGLRWTHDGKEILKLVEEKFDNIYLLTTPMSNLQSATGKMLWVQRHLPKYIKRIIITQAPKSLLARPDTLLIDDKNKNVEEFYKVGGEAILLPRPWNKLHGWSNETLTVIKNSLEMV